MNNKPDRFMGGGARPVPESRFSWTSVRVLPELTGRKWDEVSLAYCLSLRPECIRVSTGMVTLDACTDRMTVMTDGEGVIQFIEMEVKVPLPRGIENAWHLRQMGTNKQQPPRKQ